jgi:type IV pilus assembly protein PilA
VVVDRARDERGFTLMELMVVVLIIAILIAIVVPTFISARARAENRAAQSNLRHALIAAKVIYTDRASFASADESASGLISVEPALTYVAHGSSSSKPKVISVYATDSTWSAAVHSGSGNCYWIREVANSGITYGGDVNRPTTCSGDDADSASDAAFP